MQSHLDIGMPRVSCKCRRLIWFALNVWVVSLVVLAGLIMFRVMLQVGSEGWSPVSVKRSVGCFLLAFVAGLVYRCAERVRK